MSLTVPKAGVIAGRAPALSQVPVAQSQAGAAMGALGDRLLQVGTALEEERSQRELSQARVQMMNGLNDLRLKYEQVGDPDVIDRDFGAEASGLRDQIVGGLSARSQPAAGDMFNEMQASHAMALGGRAIDLRQSQRMATLAETTNATVQAGATADPTTQAVYLGQLDDHLAELVATGTITPEQAQTRRMDAAAEMESARATRLLSDNPQALIDQIDKGAEGGFSNLGADRLQSFRARAVADLAAQAARNLSEQNRADKERLASAKDFLKDGIGVFGRGRDWAESDKAAQMLADPTIAALPEAREYAQAKLLHENMPQFAALPMTEKRRLLAEAKAKPIEKPYDGDLVAAMQSQIAADEKGWKEDRFAHAAEILPTKVPALPDPLTASADELVAGLKPRIRYATSLRDAGHVSDVKYFSPAEAESWKAAAAESQSPAVRAKLASAFAVAFGDQVEEASAEIGAEPLFSYVGGLIANGGGEVLARQIFDGARAIKAGDTRMPAAPQRRSAFFREFQSLFADGTMPGQLDEAAGRDQIIAAADALYAYCRRGDPNATDAVLDEDAYRQAVHEVMGGTGAFDSNQARGGVQTIHDRLTMLPPDVAGADVTRALEMMRTSAYDPVIEDYGWRTVSASGNAPRAGGEPLTAKDVKALSLRWVEGNAYELLVTDPSTGQLAALRGDNGSPYLVDVRKLVSSFGGQK